MIKTNTKTIGDIGESAILSEFSYYGIPVYLPFSDNTEVDMIADFGGKLNKIQVKTTENIIKGVMKFNTGSRRYGVDHKYGNDEIDYLALYCVENRMACLIKYDGSNSRAISFRVQPTTNGQVLGTRYARDFTFDKYFTR